MLELNKIRKSYDGVTILDNISLSIESGEILSILGPSGCGKTTLLNLILGITDADSGEIWFEGRNITRVPMEERGFNIVFQDYALFPNLNVYKNITYGLRNKPDISTGQEVQELIDLLGLREHLAKGIDQLSGGQKQRVAIARALLLRPQILLLDEPTSALDMSVQAEILNLLNRLKQEHGMTYLLVSHDADVIAHMSDRAAFMAEGVIQRFFDREALVNGEHRMR